MENPVHFIRFADLSNLSARIWEHRIFYSQERDEHFALYWLTTVRDVQRCLRGEQVYLAGIVGEEHAPTLTREQVINDLLHAVRDTPHPLWTLLLIVAFEKDLRALRAQLGTPDDASVDARILSTIEETVHQVDLVGDTEEYDEPETWVAHFWKALLQRLQPRPQQRRPSSGRARPPVPRPRRRVVREETERVRIASPRRRRWSPELAAATTRKRERAQRIRGRREKTRLDRRAQ